MTLHDHHARTLRRRGRRAHHRDREESPFHRFFSHGRGGRSVRRGNVRLAILSVLGDRPMHGYEIIRELENRTQGRWRPSAGSVYPTLQLLEDEGLLASEDVEGRRTYSLTDAGRRSREEQPLGDMRWFEAEVGGEPDLRRLTISLVAAARQVERTGSLRANEAAREILVDARRRIYRLLAEDDLETDARPAGGA